ncbi:MAG TPA: hypothetical protein VKW04_13945 [Planctomycetota bacterium]|nr:hypothetical protein [Planctomycetota bacterium]
MELARIHRHRTIIEDPARFGCLCAAAALLFVANIPFWMTMAVVGITQLAPIMMAARALEQGWSRRWGPRVHPAVYASNLAMDYTNLAACTVVGALLLVRHYQGVDTVRLLAILTVAICFLPDIRLCRWLLSGDPVEASLQLRNGSILRDPVMLGALLATGGVAILDRGTLEFVFYSLIFLQFNALLVLVDKYLPEIESRRRAGWKALLLEREGRRLWLTLAPLGLIPLRLAAGDRVSWAAAAGIVVAIVLPDLLRMGQALVTGVANLFRVTPASPATYIVLPK